MQEVGLKRAAFLRKQRAIADALEIGARTARRNRQALFSIDINNKQ